MKFFLFTTLIVISIIYSGCKKKEKNTDPQPSCVSENFTFVDSLKVSSQNIDFKLKDSDTITAKFSNKVHWSISIKGASSGTERVYSGYSDSISIVWDGKSAYSSQCYSAEEDVNITLTVPCNQIYTETIHQKNNPSSAAIINPLSVSLIDYDYQLQNLDTIKATFSQAVDWRIIVQGVSSGAERIYYGKSDIISIIWDGRPGQNKFFLTEEDVTVTLSLPCNQNYTKTVHIKNYPNGSDIKGVLVSDFDGGGYMPNQTVINGYSATGWSSYSTMPNKINKLEVTSTPILAPQSSSYLTFQGTAGPQSWYMGSAEVNGPSVMPGSNADSTYFNAYLSSVSPSTTLLAITFQVSGKNYTYSLPLNWQGWKLVSIKLSDFKDSKGQAITDASQLTFIDLGLNCLTQPGQNVEMDIDYIYFSYGKSLN
jgi:hypothetical protein